MLIRYLDYATLGVVIGHEIAHAFDSTSQKDADSSNMTWWPQSIHEKYSELADCFSKQFSNYTVKQIGAQVSN